MKIPFLKLSKIFLPISILLVVASIVTLLYPGPRLSIEFTGGTLMEYRLPEGKTNDDLKAALSLFADAKEEFANVSIAKTREGSYFVRSQSLSNEKHVALQAHLKETLGDVQELQFNTIGPTVGQSLKQRSLLALVAATLAIIAYIALAFRKIPRKLNPWRFGMIAVVALLHDIFITVGIFTLLSYYTTFQVDTLFISALLSIMGYSVNDTIVIFDRIRDNLEEERKMQDFGQLAELSLQQTITRTINTGLGALIMLFALFFLGSESIRWFILTLIIGTIIGTYSSFFIATPLLVFWRKKTN